MDRDTARLAPQGPVTKVFLRLFHTWLDGGYNGHGKGEDWIAEPLGRPLELVANRLPSKFRLLKGQHITS